MRRAKPFDKKTAAKYALVHRPQHDPLVHDTDAPQQVFAEIPSSSKQGGRQKIKSRHDLENEFGVSTSIRANEGEAAEHGIYFDDTSYDYMQHLRDLGGSSEATWIEPTSGSDVGGKGKSKISLEDALRQATLDDNRSQADSSVSNIRDDTLVEDREVLPTTWRQKYQGQQAIPDELGGFQPDMDPRLREVLEALEDDEYVDDDEELFTQLAGDSHEEIDHEDWEADSPEDGYLEDEDGWESDDTTKPTHEYTNTATAEFPKSTLTQQNGELENQFTVADSEDDGSWLATFAKSKTSGDSTVPLAQNSSKIRQNPKDIPPSDIVSSAALSSASQLSRHKKRKGALTSSTGFSMSSSALARTEPLSTLDSRFDRIAESYLEDEEDDEFDMDDSASIATGMTGRTDRSKFSAFGGSQTSATPSLVTANLDATIDDFLGGANGNRRGRAMKKAGRQGRWGMQTGMEQLDEVRQGLGPARVKSKQPNPPKV